VRKRIAALPLDVRKGSAFLENPFLIGGYASDRLGGAAYLHNDERDGKAKPFRTSGGEAAKAEVGNYGARFHFNAGVASVKS
jgi:hypothetical protein